MNPTCSYCQQKSPSTWSVQITQVQHGPTPSNSSFSLWILIVPLGYPDDTSIVNPCKANIFSYRHRIWRTYIYILQYTYIITCIHIYIYWDRWIDRERDIYIYRYMHFPPVSPSFLECQRWTFTPKSFRWPGPLWQYLQVFGMLLVGTVEVLEDHGTSADLGGCAVLPCCHRSFNTGDHEVGKHTLWEWLRVCYWKWPFLVYLPIENGDFP